MFYKTFMSEYDCFGTACVVAKCNRAAHIAKFVLHVERLAVHGCATGPAHIPRVCDWVSVHSMTVYD